MDDNTFIKDAALVSWVIKYNPDKIKNEEVKIDKNIETIQRIQASGKRAEKDKMAASYFLGRG
ncbi:hypothetical protein [Aeromonas veronii]|uniref:hypothetical protein n=1 Tax=Aeromonas veronii TaxID=654 RepID=UPI001F1FDDD4|nr:hypothetical protein [Aeromonas veronii]MCF5914109.1 hypothetical protein [Aeromonas veronii]